MTAAHRRLDELLERWRGSLERHTRYLALDDAAYARAEAWPKHQRPSRWVVELAARRLQELQAQANQRKDAGDAAFAESLELMAFLTSLLGSEHIERYIPLATGKPPDTAASATVQQPRLKRPPKPAPPAASSPPAEQGAARGRPSPGKAVAASTAAGGGHKRDTGRHPALRRAPAQASEPSPSARTAQATGKAAPTATPRPAPPKQPTDAGSRQVIADAVRLLEWGREWPALAGLIARMAGRPAETEVWTILRAHRADILAKAGRAGR
jgi:hypothetical protein